MILDVSQQEGVDFERAYEIGGVVDPVERLRQFRSPCPACLNPDYGKPTAFQPPRRFRFALKSL